MKNPRVFAAFQFLCWHNGTRTKELAKTRDKAAVLTRMETHQVLSHNGFHTLAWHLRLCLAAFLLASTYIVSQSHFAIIMSNPLEEQHPCKRRRIGPAQPSEPAEKLNTVAISHVYLRRFSDHQKVLDLSTDFLTSPSRKKTPPSTSNPSPLRQTYQQLHP